MNSIIRLSGAVLVLLVIIRAAIKPSFLPIGGDDVIQMAVVFGAAFALSEVLDLFSGKE